MKKFLSIILCLCLLASLFVMPVSAAAPTMSEAYVDSTNISIIDHFYADGSNAVPITDYPLSNLIDNNSSTVATSAGLYTAQSDGSKRLSGASFTIDLGAEYPITSISYAVTTAAQQTTFKEDYSDYTSGLSSLTGCHVYASNERMTGYNAGHGSNKVNTMTGYHNTPTLKHATVWDGVQKYRYIHFTSPGNTWLFTCGEISVKYACNDGNMHASPMHTGTQLSYPKGYGSVNMIDGDPNTVGFVGQYSYNTTTETATVSKGHAMIDLGSTKKIKTIKVIPASTSQVNEFKEIATNWSSSSGNITSWSAGAIHVSNDIPYLVDINTFGGTRTRVNSSSSLGGTYTIDGEYRYITIESFGNSYPMLISEIEITYDDREGSVSFETSAAAGTVPAARISYYTPNAYSVAEELPVSNIFDDDDNTYGFIGSLNANKNAYAGAVVIDLGREVALQRATWRTATSDAEALEILEAIGITGIYVSGGGSHIGGINSCVTGGIHASNTAPTINDDGTVTNYGTNIKDSNAAWGYEDWRWNNRTTLDGTTSYRYITLTGSQNYPLLLSDFKLFDTEGNNVLNATKEVIRFYAAPTLTSKSYDTEEFGMYIVPFNLFNDDATENGVMMSMNGKIVTGQNYAADLTGIPAEAADEPIVVVPFVKLGGDYFYGDASSQYTLNGLK